MALVKTITQGGQVHIHQLRMLKQVVCAGLILSLLAGGGYFAWKCGNLPIHVWRAAYETYWANMMVATNPAVNHNKLTQMYTPTRGTPFKRSCVDIQNDRNLQRTTKKVERYVILIGNKSLWMMLWSYLAVMGFWFIFGVVQKRKKHQRGATMVPWRELKRLMRRNRDLSRLKLKLKFWGKLPLLKNKETSHILMTGTTGSGKTNGFHHLLPQIRKRNLRALIVDVTGDYVSRYYDPSRDVILNPFDSRSQPWHPWADCHQDFHYDLLAESFIQTKEGAKDPFWDNASRMILKTALRKYAASKDFDIEKLTNFLLSSSDLEFEKFFKGTEAITFALRNNDKTTASIRSVLSSQIEGFRQLTSTTQKIFSIRDWVKNERTSWFSWVPDFWRPTPKGGWLFLSARPDQRQTLTPLMSAWLDIAISSLMVLPENQKRRLWFVMDELAALQKLPRLPMGLAESRKYGGCFLVGFQSKPQLEEIYGKNSAEAMLDLFNTKLFFRCTEPSTQQWISKILGDREEEQPTENISFGAHSMRDGVSLSRHTRQTPLIMPAELSQLKDLQCYVKYPGDYPCTKIRMKYRNPKRKKEAFLLRAEKEKKASVDSSTQVIPQNKPSVSSLPVTPQMSKAARKTVQMEVD